MKIQQAKTHPRIVITFVEFYEINVNKFSISESTKCWMFMSLNMIDWWLRETDTFCYIKWRFVHLTWRGQVLIVHRMLLPLDSYTELSSAVLENISWIEEILELFEYPQLSQPSFPPSTFHSVFIYLSHEQANHHQYFSQLEIISQKNEKEFFFVAIAELSREFELFFEYTFDISKSILQQ
jgi:hypothetical protein